MRIVPAVLLLLAACGNNDSDEDTDLGNDTTDAAGTEVDTEADTEEPDTEIEDDTDLCDNSVDSVFPENGDTSAFYRTSIEVELDEAESAASIRLSGPNGDIAGTTSIDDDVITFIPSAALSPSTDYTIAIDYSCGTATTTFSTSDVGTSVPTTDIAGNTYSVDLAQGRFVEPAGIGGILGDFIDQEILIGVQSATNADIQLIGALADGGTPPNQGECEPTIPFQEDSFVDNPFFQIGPQTTTISLEGFAVPIDDLKISGAFSPDGTNIAGATLAGVMDTRPMTALLNADDNCDPGAPRCCDTDVDPGCSPATDTADCCDEDAVCDLASQIGVACEPCDDGTGTFCLSLLVTNLQAEQVMGVDIDPQHLPADDATAPADSTNICDIGTCFLEDACIDQPLR